jgi:ribonuclease III
MGAAAPIVTSEENARGRLLLWLRGAAERLLPRSVQTDLSRVQIRDLERRLQYHFRDVQLLMQSLKHRSYVYSRQGHGVDSNERLEYLGDAVLDVVVAEFLFRRYVDQREGDLTQIKSLAVSRTVLARRARGIDLGRFILLSPEERNAGGANQDSILSDAFEAVIGAIHLDGGLPAARGFIERVALHDIDELHRLEDFINFKSKLLEHVQSQGSGHPKYQVQDETGPDHEKVFSVEVRITGQTMGAGQGRSKKEAQQMAARDALQRLGQI